MKKSDKKKRSLLGALPAVPYVVWMVLFIAIPLGMVAFFALTDPQGQFTLENIARGGEHMSVLLRSIKLATIATILCIIIAYPLAYILSRKQGFQKQTLFVMVMLPMWMNFLLRTYAWLNLLDDGGILFNICRNLDLPTFSVVGTNAAIIMGMIYNFLPFMVLPLFNVLTKIDENVLNAARDLGANSAQVFFKVTLPLSLPGIISGVTMVFVPSLTTFAISDLLGARKIMLIGNIIEQEFSTADNWHLGSGLSLVLMVFILISMAVLEHYDKNGEGTSF